MPALSTIKELINQAFGTSTTAANGQTSARGIRSDLLRTKQIIKKYQRELVNEPWATPDLSQNLADLQNRTEVKELVKRLRKQRSMSEKAVREQTELDQLLYDLDYFKIDAEVRVFARSISLRNPWLFLSRIVRARIASHCLRKILDFNTVHLVWCSILFQTDSLPVVPATDAEKTFRMSGTASSPSASNKDTQIHNEQSVPKGKLKTITPTNIC
ncbi:hypothetical protein FRC03_001053 [Tulasnella sp. 419]|nr:hypothetical protein FRC03_001053 [Tulasnella sp. 419]